METELLVGLATICGGLLGAALQNLWHHRNARVTELERYRAESYVALLRSMADLTMAQRAVDTAGAQQHLFDAQGRVAEARARIAVYGNKGVAKTLASFLRNHGALDSAEATKSFIAVIQNMRAGLSALRSDTYEHDIDIDDLAQLVVGHDVTGR